MANPVTVVALTPVTGGPYYGEVLAGVVDVLGAAGGRLVVVQTLDAGHARDEVVSAPDDVTPVGWAELDGVISITTGAPKAHLERVRASGRPVVMASGPIDGFAAPSASPDNSRGVSAAVAHLIGHGHRRIGFVGNLVQADVRERRDAYEQTLRSHGIDPSASWFFEASDNGEAGGRGAARALLAAGMPVTAVMVGTDRNALALVEQLAAQGVSVPGDLAVVGVDGIERGSYTSPTLSTVRQDFAKVGILAAELLLAEIQGGPVPREPHAVPSLFLPRESCGCGITTPHADRSDGEPATASGPLARAVSAVEAAAGPLESIALAAASGQDPPVVDLRRLAARISALDLPPDELRTVVDTLTDRIGAIDAAGPAGRAALVRCAGRLTSLLWQAQAAAYLDRGASLERAVSEHYDVGHRLLEGDRVDPRELAWMSTTQVRAACFAMWSEDPDARRLDVVGAYDPHGILRGLVGQTMAVESFPPAAMVAGADARLGQVTFVIPVRARGTDWGMLAIVGVVEAAAASGREKYNQWAALLATSLEQAELHAAVRTSEERYTLAGRATNDGLWDWNRKDDTIYYSDRCLALLGADRPSGSGGPQVWFDAVHPDDAADLRDALEAGVAEADPAPIEVEHRVRSRDGGYRYLLCRALPVCSPTGVVERIVGSLSDIHPRKELEEQLRRNALYDAVTGLPNRTLFWDRLAQLIAQARRGPHLHYAVLFIDLDHFKVVNDTFGHPMGDRVLAEVGHRLRAGLREVDVASRFGGDEFALLLHDIEPSRVRAAVERMQATLREPIDLDGHPVTVTASVGIAIGDTGYSDADDVLRDADVAMYAAKTARRGSYQFFDRRWSDANGDDPPDPATAGSA